MRRAWLALAAVTVLLSGCNDSNKTVITDTVVKVGAMSTPVTRDGIFEYTVGGVDCGAAAVGDAVAKGQFCTVAITVHNLSDAARKPGITIDVAGRRST
ncbi:hypothetical protein [Actinoplanes sp. NPDC026619]|uniref:hypothetical protein n=1 Tax=Actinoplanes sp. NPDC026619 TaxID=3155798 RepID=UPI003402E622